MSNAYRSALLGLLLALPPASAQVADPIEERQRAPLAGRYALQGSPDAGSELLLKPDGRFEWSLRSGAMAQSATGRWNVGAGMVVLTAQAPAQPSALFSLDEVAPWNAGAQKRLDEFAQERYQALTEDACGYLRTYRVGLEQGELGAATTAAADPGGPTTRCSGAEGELAPALAALEQARLALETAAAAVRPIPWQRPPSAIEAAAAAAQAAATGVDRDGQDTADRAAQTYLERLQQARSCTPPPAALPALRDPRLGRERCLDPAAQADPSGGYAVVVGDPALHARAEGIGVEFVYSDGRSERSETSPGGWALVCARRAAGTGGPASAGPAGRNLGAGRTPRPDLRGAPGQRRGDAGAVRTTDPEPGRWRSDLAANTGSLCTQVKFRGRAR
ncbi:hypothetical protein FE772_20390 [Lysobacter enzymogenes]|nr:hypothetical protein [Lysobacter enzymogenes]QCW27645.1 hypothetical protein FE772_20390 [Lysobacter enzymogenes]